MVLVGVPVGTGVLDGTAVALGTAVSVGTGVKVGVTVGGIVGMGVGVLVGRGATVGNAPPEGTGGGVPRSYSEPGLPTLLVVFLTPSPTLALASITAPITASEIRASRIAYSTSPCPL